MKLLSIENPFTFLHVRQSFTRANIVKILPFYPWLCFFEAISHCHIWFQSPRKLPRFYSSITQRDNHLCVWIYVYIYRDIQLLQFIIERQTDITTKIRLLHTHSQELQISGSYECGKYPYSYANHDFDTISTLKGIDSQSVFNVQGLKMDVNCVLFKTPSSR